MYQTPSGIPVARDATSTPPRRPRNIMDESTFPDLSSLSLTSPTQQNIRHQIPRQQQPKYRHSRHHSLNQDQGPFENRVLHTQPTHREAALLSHYQSSAFPGLHSVSSAISPSRTPLDLPSNPQSSSLRTTRVGRNDNPPLPLIKFQTPSLRAAPNHGARSSGASTGMVFNSSIHTTPQCLGSPLPPGLSVEGSPPDHDFTSKFENLFKMVEKYSSLHLNFPANSKDQELPHSIKDRLMQAATRETASQIASTGHTRFLLMTKVILQWMIKHVFKQDLFANFDMDADHRIASVRDTIYQDTPIMVKHQLLSEISDEIKRMRRSPEFPSFFENLVRNQSGRLWVVVRPLMHQTTAMDWEDLQQLMREAYLVASEAAATPYQWRFDFAPIGKRYDTSMVNRDPYLRGSDEEIARRDVPVRLGFKPAVFFRDNSSGVMKMVQITRQSVILKG